MASLWSRRNKQKGGLSSPPASEVVDLGMFIQKNGLERRVEDAVLQQPAVGDPKEEFAEIRRMQQMSWLKKALRVLCPRAWLKDRSKQHRASGGAEESWRTARTRKQATERRAEPEGKAPGEPRTCRKATRGGEEPVDTVAVVSIHSVVPRLEKDVWDELVVGCKARAGDMLRGGGGHGDEMGQTQPLVQAGSSGAVEGRASPRSLGLQVKDKDGATIPQGDGDRQVFNPPERSGEERRRQVWDKLQRLGEDMARWEGRSTRDMSVRLMEVILQTETRMYPMEMGNKSNQLEQGQRGLRARAGSSEEVAGLVDTCADVTTMQQCPQLQDPDMYNDVSVFTVACGDSWHLPTATDSFEIEQFWEDSDDNFPEQEGPLDVPQPVAQVFSIMMLKDRTKEQWREEFPDIWARYELDCGLVSRVVEVSGGPVPFQRQPPLPADMENKVASILQVLLEDSVVVHGRSSSNSPLMLIQKRNRKSQRLVLDCRAIHKVTHVVVKPVDLGKTKLLTALSPKSKYFSYVDLSNASFAIPLAAGSRAKFAFTFRGQQYLFTRLPQGFRSTNPIVHQRVAEMLSQLPEGDKPWVFSHIDDILIAGKSQNETKARTTRVLKLIQETGFKAKFEKAQLVQPKVDYLGMTIGAEGQEIQASKLEATRKTRSPRDVHGVRSLLGWFGNFQDHIPNYWELALPLHHLTMEHVGWVWGPEQEQALSSLKQAVLTAPALRFPDRSQPFVIRVMTGQEAVGAALLQENEWGQLVPVHHCSRILKDHEAAYVPEEKGCLAAVWAVRAFETFTGPAPILIPMPHSPWKYLLRGEALGSGGTNPCPAQWTLLLVNGGEMTEGPQPAWEAPPSPLVPPAPPLWQLPSNVPKANVWFTASEEFYSMGFAAANLEERWLLGVAEGASSVLDAELEALWQLLGHHRCSSPLYLYTGCQPLVAMLESQSSEWGPGASSGEGLWPRVQRWVHANPGMLHVGCVGADAKEMEWNQKVGRRARVMSAGAVGGQLMWEPSKYERQEIIAQCHGWMHEEVEETLARVRWVAAWEGDHEQVARWVQNCLRCATGKVLPQRGEGPWSQLQLGYVTGLPKSEEGHHSFLVLEDEFSGWVEAFPLRAVEEMAKVLFQEVFARHGTPHTIRLPHVLPFLRDVVVMAAAGMNPPWEVLQPGQAAAATEALRRLAQGAGKDWVKMLPVILAGFRSMRAQGAALSTYQAVGGFPLEMRWGCEAGGGPRDNVLSWLRGLREDGAGYRHLMEAVRQRDCLEEDGP